MSYAAKQLERYFQFRSVDFIIFQQSLKMYMHSTYLSVYPSVCAHFNCGKYSLNVFIYAFPNWYRMDNIEILKMMFMRLRVRLQTHTKFFRCNAAYEGGTFLKLIVRYLCYTKCNAIKIFHSVFVNRITQKTDLLWGMLGNDWICILNLFLSY